jgi:hypothetical protein
MTSEQTSRSDKHDPVRVEQDINHVDGDGRDEETRSDPIARALSISGPVQQKPVPKPRSVEVSNSSEEGGAQPPDESASGRLHDSENHVGAGQTALEPTPGTPAQENEATAKRDDLVLLKPTLLQKFGEMALFILIVGTALILATVSFLAFLWFFNIHNSTWQAIAVKTG